MKHASRLWIAMAAVLALAFALVGCGGGSSSSTTTGTTNLNTFVTDDLTPLYDQVWVDFYGINLVKADGSTVALYSNAAGDHINVRALNNGTNGIYRFLGSTPIPAGTYKGFTMLLGKSVTLYATGSTTPTTAQFPDEFDAGTPNQSLLKIDFAAPKTFTDGENFPIDFNLKAWSIKAGNKIVWSILKGDGNGLDDPNRHEQHGISGEIADLAGTAPTQTFTLLPKENDDRKVPVTTNDKTVVIAASNSDSPTLANGQKVEVVGSFDTTTKTFVPTLIRIRPATVASEQGARGIVSDAVATGTFKLAVGDAFGFVPAERKINVTTTADTMFYDGTGAAITMDAFFSQVATLTEPKARIAGAYDKASNTFAATRVMLEKASDAVRKVNVIGNVSEIHAGTDFTIALKEWDGFAGALGLTAKIVVSDTTQYQDLNEAPLTKEQFFAALSVGKVAAARGTLAAGGVVNADVVRIRQNSSTDGHDGAEAFGIPDSVNVADGFFQIKLIKWHGFDSQFGKVVKVTFADGATFFDKSNHSVSKADWLALVQGDIKRSVSIEGSYSGDTFVAVRARQND